MLLLVIRRVNALESIITMLEKGFPRFSVKFTSVFLNFLDINSRASKIVVPCGSQRNSVLLFNGKL